MRAKDITRSYVLGECSISCPAGPIMLEGAAGYFNGCFMRLPKDIYDKVNPDVTGLASNTSGMTLRFRTDAQKLGIKVVSTGGAAMNHMPLTGSAGVDVYSNGEYSGTVKPRADEVCCTSYSGNVMLRGAGMRSVDINFPLYNGVKDISLVMDCDAQILPPYERRIKQSIAYYGSSITQGGCASRPGNSYTAMISRMLDVGQINLGFSGAGRGEKIMAQYIATLKLSAFVLDYDHNAPDVEHLEKTHYVFFRVIRDAQPRLPVVIVTKPDYYWDEAVNEQRRRVIYRTYEQALSNGDRNVWFVDGKTLFGGDSFADSCTVDGCHPNDLGFSRMAKHIGAVLAEALGIVND